MQQSISNKAIVDYTSPVLCTPVTPAEHVGGGPSHRHKQLAQKIGKDRACGFGDILADRQTHRPTYSSQYFATAAAGEVIMTWTLKTVESVV